MKNKPVRTFRDGALKVMVWRNERENGLPFYSLSFSRTYKGKDGQFKDAYNFSGLDVLRICRLAEQAQAQISVIRDHDLFVEQAGLEPPEAPAV